LVSRRWRFPAISPTTTASPAGPIPYRMCSQHSVLSKCQL
jgi:hypothetical protein